MAEPNYHDHFFREAMSQPEVMADFLVHYLPPDVAAAIDPTSAEVIPGTFVDEQLREHRSDLIYRVRMKSGEAAYIYIILEHKSFVYPMVSWQVLRYAMETWVQEVNGGASTLTPILPVVFYHGASRWNVAREFSALFDWQGREMLRPFTPDFRYYFLDLSTLKDEEIMGGWRLRAVLITLKHIFDRQLTDLWQRLIETLRNVPEKIGLNVLTPMMKYILGVREVTQLDLDRMVEATYPQAKENTMSTLTQTWVEQGIQKGIQQGRIETLQVYVFRYLTHRFGAVDEATQTRIRKLPVDALDALTDAWWNFTSLDDLTAWLDRNDLVLQ
ncbi:MAG: Rpn family recombination-promoting nuclease/putative transposase [Blastocatellia bacterium]